MRWVLIIVGVLFILVGLVWVLQGTNVLTQGVMAGHGQWTVIGGILAAVGVVLIVLGAARRRATGA
jgi:uncharacterized integral membrane protein